MLECSLSTLGKGLRRFPEYIPSNRGTQPFTGTALCLSCCRAGGLGCTQQLFWDPRGLLGGKGEAMLHPSATRLWAGWDPCCPQGPELRRLWSELSGEKGNGERKQSSAFLAAPRMPNTGKGEEALGVSSFNCIVFVFTFTVFFPPIKSNISGGRGRRENGN